MIAAVKPWSEAAFMVLGLIVVLFVFAWAAHLRIDGLRDRVKKLEDERK